MIDELSTRTDSLLQEISVFMTKVKGGRRDYEELLEHIGAIESKARRIERILEEKAGL